MQQRLFYTLQHLPLRVQGVLCIVSIQQEQAAPGTEAYGEISDWDTSLDSNGKLKVGIVSISYSYCTEIGTQEFI